MLSRKKVQGYVSKKSVSRTMIHCGTMIKPTVITNRKREAVKMFGALQVANFALAKNRPFFKKAGLFKAFGCIDSRAQKLKK